MKVLLVEPSRFLRSVIGSIFVRYNLDVEMVDSAAQALDALQSPPDMLCFSLELGDMRGTDFFREAQRRIKEAEAQLIEILKAIPD